MTEIVGHRAGYSADMVSPVAILSGGNLRDPALDALRSGGLLQRKSVRRDAPESTDTCVLRSGSLSQLRRAIRNRQFLE
jgi:hypothetical protein